MPHKRRRKTKQQLIGWHELALLGCSLVSLHFLTVTKLPSLVISERDEGIWSFVDSFWFALMTLTTVGYDLNPVTLLGKVIHLRPTIGYPFVPINDL